MYRSIKLIAEDVRNDMLHSILDYDAPTNTPQIEMLHGILDYDTPTNRRSAPQ